MTRLALVIAAAALLVAACTSDRSPETPEVTPAPEATATVDTSPTSTTTFTPRPTRTPDPPPTIRTLPLSIDELDTVATFLGRSFVDDPCADVAGACVATSDLTVNVGAALARCQKFSPTDARDLLAGSADPLPAYFALAEATCLILEDGFRTLGPVTDANTTEWRVIAARARDLATLAFEEGQRLQERLDAIK